VLVCGDAVLVELEPEPEVAPDDDVSSEVDDGVAAVACLAVVVPVSLHAMAPPRDRAAVTLRAAAIRRAR
jgi:hypothetical protein